MLRKGIFLTIFLTIPVVADDSPEVKALKKDMPPDVALVIDRTVACNRWRGEESSNKERAERINKELEKWACSTIEQDQAKLAKRYQNNYQIKARIQDANYLF